MPQLPVDKAKPLDLSYDVPLLLATRHMVRNPKRFQRDPKRPQESSVCEDALGSKEGIIGRPAYQQDSAE